MKSQLLLYGLGLVTLTSIAALRNQFYPAPIVAVVSKQLSGAAIDCASAKGLERVICLADAFKATLSSSQIAAVQLPYSKADAAKWSNFPQAFSRPQRVGLRLGSLNATQLTAAKALMASVLATGMTNEGYDELEGNLAADDYFGTAVGKTDVFGAGNYYIAFLGAPSTTTRWELQFGGHHYAVANTYNGGKTTGVTPAFRGVEPMSAVTANGRTYQPVEQERQAFATLLGNLTSSEQTTAKLASSFRDILLGPGVDGQFPTAKQGLRVGNLSAARQKLVINAIKCYVDDLDPTTAATVLARYSADLADTYLAYSGSVTMSQPGDYVRLDGPGIWIEYSGQPSRDFPGTAHPHSVWRDHTSDYGGTK